MAIARVSDKGQITLPANMRRQLGIQPKSRVEIEVKGKEVVIRSVGSITELSGVLREYAKGKPTDWETIRTQTERLVAEEVSREGLE